MQHFQGFADVAEKTKIDENRRKIAPTMLRERTAQRKLDFSAPGRDLVSILVSSACSQALQGALSGVPGDPWRPSGRFRGAPGTLRDAPETLPRRSRDAFGTLLDATGCPERVPGPIFSRFWVPRGVSRDRFSIDFLCDFRSILRASWPANGKTLDGQVQ